MCSSHRRTRSSLCTTCALLPFAVHGCSSPPLTTQPLGAPLPPQLLAVRRPLHALHPRISHRRPRMASSWRIWPARILLLWLRRPRRHLRHAAIAAVASPAIGAGACSPSARFHTRNATTASAALTPRAGYRTNCCPRSHVVIARPPTPPSSPLPFPVPKL